jgi:hypothetical protein
MTVNTAPVPKPRPTTGPRANKNYLSNSELLAEFKLCKEKGKMSDRFTKMMILLCDRYASKGNFAAYTYIDDMKNYALLNIVKNWATFNPERSSNPFAYYTQFITNSFRQYLNNEKKQRNIRDSLLISKGLDPSFTFSIEYGMTENQLTDKAILFHPDEVMYAPQEVHHEEHE